MRPFDLNRCVTELVLLTSAAIIVCSPGIGNAVEAEFTIAHHATIADPEGNVRYLIDPGDLAEIDGELVTSAKLEIQLSGNVPEQDVDVFVTGLGREWVGRTPTWQSPWTEAGGDLDKSYGYTVTLAQGKPASHLVMDVTQFVRDMADRQSAKNGFLLTCSGTDQRKGFNATETAILGSLSDGVLRVTYVKISALGYHDGSLSFRNRGQ